MDPLPNSCYGFSTRFRGRHPHRTIATFNSMEDILRWCDPHRERIWEEASDADETKLLISCDFRAVARTKEGDNGLLNHSRYRYFDEVGWAEAFMDGELLFRSLSHYHQIVP